MRSSSPWPAERLLAFGEIVSGTWTPARKRSSPPNATCADASAQASQIRRKATSLPKTVRPIPAPARTGGFTIFSHVRFRLDKSSLAVGLICSLFVTPAAIVGLAGPAVAVAPGANGKIVYNSGDGHICVMNADGSGSVDLTPTTSGNYNPTWSPGGSKIAFNGFHSDTVSEIYAMNADGTGLTQLTDDGVISDHAAWSPDGTKIAFETVDESDPGSKYEIHVINADGTGHVALTNGSSGDAFEPAWSPDGSSIAYDALGPAANSVDMFYQIWQLQADGSNPRQVTTDAVNHVSPSWSPDGTRIAFGQLDDTTFGSKIRTSDLNGQNQVTVTSGVGTDDASPSWSPDGRLIAFERVQAGILVANPDGSGLRSLSAGGQGPDWASIPAAGTAAPGAPTGVTATPGDRSATVSWSAPASNGGAPLTKYTVKTTGPTGSFSTKDVTSGTSTTVTGLTNGTQYTITVTATNSAGTGPASSPPVSVTPAAAATAPGAPTGVSATAGDASATVSWSTPASNGGSAITKYTVAAQPSSGPAVTKDVSSGTSTTLTGLTNGTTYAVTVTATNAAGTGPASSPAVSVTPAAPVAATTPGAPTGVTASAGDASATVTWSAPASDGGAAITKYTVTAQPASGTAVTKDVTSANSTTITGLTNDTAYAVSVTASNAVGTGPASSPPASVTPTAAPAGVTAPDAPTAVSATAGDGEVTITWEAPASDGGAPVLDYLVVASTGEAIVSDASPATLRVPNNTTRTFTVTARNAVGYGPDSAPSNAVTFGSEGVTALTIARQPSSILPGRPIDVSGRLQGADVADKVITITMRAYHAAPKAYTTSTDASGAWRLRFRPFTNATYTASLPATPPSGPPPRRPRALMSTPSSRWAGR